MEKPEHHTRILEFLIFVTNFYAISVTGTCVTSLVIFGFISSNTHSMSVLVNLKSFYGLLREMGISVISHFTEMSKAS